MIDIILTTCNRLPLLKRTLTSFFRNTPSRLVGKIIITDDGSTDGTAAFLAALRARHDNLTVLGRPGERLGLIPRFNQAFAISESDFLCEFQDDVEFEAGWLARLYGLIGFRGADFVTGFDAPEHTAYECIGAFKLKKSSRFTQLLAPRRTWARWFPMRPMHDFPTPALVDGESIGSGIDARLYRWRKNSPRSGVTFAVVPGVVRHLAEASGSTWRLGPPRLPVQRRPDPELVQAASPGLSFDAAGAYWRARAGRQGELAVGFAGRPADEQEKILAEKQAFIMPKLEPGALVLDYGCGVGKFAARFNPSRYLGCDFTPEFLAIARRNNPAHRFHQLKAPLPEQVPFYWEWFFACNVLQHCSDTLVFKVLTHLQGLRPGGFHLALYENTQTAPDKPHMRFRSAQAYRSLLGRFFEIKSFEAFEHVVHGETHTLMKVAV